MPSSASDTNGSIVVTVAEMGSSIAVVQTRVQFQVSRGQRHTVTCEVGGRADDFQTVAAKPLRHEPRVALLPGADHSVVASVDHIDHVVCELGVYLDIGIFPHEPVQGGHHQRAHIRKTYLEATFGRRFRLRQFKFDLVDL